MSEVLGTMWFSGALKGSVHRPSWTQAKPTRACLSSKHLWCPKNILEGTAPRRNKLIRAPRAFLCPSSPSLSLWNTSLSFMSPLQSVLPLWLALYLCWCSVPAFKGNNYWCIPPFEPTRQQKLWEIKLCLYRLTLSCSELYIMDLSKFDLHWVAYC